MKLPAEFLDRMKELLKEEFYQFEKSYEDAKYSGLRVNTSKVSVEDFLKITPFKLKRVPWVKDGFYYNQDERPGKHPYYHAGLYYIQEPSAMAPGEFIGIEPEDKVLDLCAAPGGKSTQIGAKLNENGLLVSNDISSSRIKALVKNIELFGMKNTVITNETPQRLSMKFENFFDKILVDAPCSGEGMFRKDEDAAKSWDRYSSEKCSILQKDILSHAAKMLKPNGYILYSTCTFSIEENEKIIEDFLSRNKGFTLVEIPKNFGICKGIGIDGSDLHKCARFWPHKLAGEGHFTALLKKTENYKDKLINPYKINKKIDLKYFYDFSREYLTKEFEGIFETYGEYLYLIHKKIPSLEGIKVVRPGFFLGMLKKGRFEPSQALAMSLKPTEVKNNINFEANSDLVIKYLKGETLNINIQKGYNIVSVDSYSLGWAKGTDSMLKNEYPPAWRVVNV